MSDAVLCLLGATGYTGRLCAAEAARQGLRVRLAGRRRDLLERLAAELGTGDVAAADVNDPAGVAALAHSSDVLLSTVGPYLRLGRPVVEAALAGGCHYVDISAEVPFLRWVRAQQERAAAAGVALCPGSGFDGAAGDLLAAAAARDFGGDVRSARAAYLVRRARVSAGTLRSALGLAAHGGAAWRDGAFVDEPVAAHHWWVPFPPPLGARGAVSVPVPEAVTLGPSTGAATARGYLVLPAAQLAVLASAPLDVAGRLVAGTPLWTLLERAADRLPQGPAPTVRAATRAAVLAEVRGPTGGGRAWARLRDPYAAPARMAVGLARRLLAAGPPRAGALTPSQVVAAEPSGALLDEVGADWSLL
ncbi:MAG TPA: saccharopine dehydrogenase NADP-binding domain-containing protein [Egibacteraceae bacterium]|nr:saccharopine dehydrogenase NADP-binding domain-containing protein [Egibacteraceae bacterium]